MSKLKKHSAFLLTLSMAVGLFFSGGVAGRALAYLTDIGDTMENNFTIALGTTTTTVEKYPDPSPKPQGDVISFEKAVQIGNTGQVDVYVRVSLHFSDSDIEGKTKFSSNGRDYYSIAEYRNHLPQGWIYRDGFYYYKPILYAGDWPTISRNLDYDDDLGEYFYKPNKKDIISGREITTPLVRYVKTVFDSPQDMRSYELSVKEESVPFYLGNDYRSAWANYIASKGR